MKGTWLHRRDSFATHFWLGLEFNFTTVLKVSQIGLDHLLHSSPATMKVSNDRQWRKIPEERMKYLEMGGKYLQIEGKYLQIGQVFRCVRRGA